MSIHTMKSMAVAHSKGAMAGEACAAPLWNLSKRELVELALRLTQAGMRGDTVGAVAEVNTELTALRANGVI